MSTTEQRANELRQARSPFVLAVVVRAERPTSAKPGDRAIIHADGTIEGFVGGSCAESTVRLQSLRQLAAGESTLLRITPGGDATGPRDLPGLVVTDNTCLSGGTIDVFLEVVMPAPLLQIYGDTPIARALVAVGEAAGYEVRLARAPGAVPTDALAVVVASHGHDETGCWPRRSRAGVPYVALVASPKRGAAVLAESGVPAGPGQDAGRARPRRAYPRRRGGLDPGRGGRGPRRRSAAAGAARAGRCCRSGSAPRRRRRSRSTRSARWRSSSSPARCPTSTTGSTWYFCAPGCRKKFAADPARWGG